MNSLNTRMHIVKHLWDSCDALDSSTGHHSSVCRVIINSVAIIHYCWLADWSLEWSGGGGGSGRGECVCVERPVGGRLLVVHRPHPTGRQLATKHGSLCADVFIYKQMLTKKETKCIGPTSRIVNFNSNISFMHRVGQKTGPSLKVCSSCIWWHRNTFYAVNCSMLYPE